MTMREEDPNLDEPRPLTHEEREVLVHALTGGRGKQVYRNYYAANPMSTYGQVCLALVRRGLMHAAERSSVSDPTLDYYLVTQSGAQAVGLHLP